MLEFGNHLEWFGKSNYGYLKYYFKPTESTEDQAYEAPDSALIKRWYDYKLYDGGKTCIQFNANGTFNYIINVGPASKYLARLECTGRWRRSKQDLTVTFNLNTLKVSSNADLSDYSLRKQDEWKKTLKELSAKVKKEFIKANSKPQKHIINILDNEHMVLDEGDNFLSEEYLIELEKVIKIRKLIE